MVQYGKEQFKTLIQKKKPCIRRALVFFELMKYNVKEAAMNKHRRNKLSEAIGYLDNALQIISDVRDDEQDALDNIPENLQQSDRYSDM